MRKWLLPIIVLLVLLSLSCRTSKEEQQDDIMSDEMERNMLVSSMKDALFLTEAEIFSDKATFTFDSSFEQYEMKLSSFRSLEDEYLETLSRILKSGVEELTDTFLEELERMDISDPQEYIEGGYTSISDELERRCLDSSLIVISRTIEKNIVELDTIYGRLEKEAGNWRDNLANLSLVGIMRSAEELRKPTVTELAIWARKQYFDLLSDNEVTARYRSGK